MSNLLQNSSVDEISNLLDLFPVNNLREQWNIKGVKSHINRLVASDSGNNEEIKKFVHEYFSLCKQHIYAFNIVSDGLSESDLITNLRSTIFQDLEFIFETVEDIVSVENQVAVCRTYLAKMTFKVILQNPLEETEINFIIPVKVDILQKCLILRFVTLERSFQSFFPDRNCYVQRKQNDKERILVDCFTKDLPNIISVAEADLHKGIKHLWKEEHIDAFKVRYKDDDSINSKDMNENKGVRKNNPNAFDKMMESILQNTLFETEKKNPAIVFSVDCTKGFITFPRYTINKGDSDYVVREIIRHNE